MLRFWRKNEGFKWVTYVPTRIRERRRRRRERIAEVRLEAKSRARAMLRRSAELARSALVRTGAGLRAGGAAAMSSAASLARRTWQAAVPGLMRLRERSLPLWRALQRPPVAMALACVGLGLLVAGLIVAARTRLDLLTLLMIGLGLALLSPYAAPIAGRHVGPPLARMALALLRRDAGRRSPLAWLPTSPAVLAGAGVCAAGAATLWLVLARGPALPPVAGTASIVSAEIIRVDANEIRLYGIAAPDPEQRCGEGSRRWNCASDAVRALATLVRGKSLSCLGHGRDEAGRMLGQCFDGARDVNAELVVTGAVWASRSDEAGYRALEAKARAAKLGVWRGPSEPPWAWREKLWDQAKLKAPDGCPIKGLIAGREKVYHMPWSAEYERIRISSSSRTRRWFCSEQQAIEAGFKAQRGS